MWAFLVRRVFFGVVVIWLMTVVVFVLFFVAGGDPARLLAGRQASAAQVEAIRRSLGLDEPLLVQYANFVGRLLRGDLGYSYYNDEPVTSLIADGLPATVSLVLGGAVLSLLVGVAIGTLSAVRTRSLADRAATVFALFFYSMPTFLLGLLLLYFLFYRLTLAGIDAFPAGGYVPITSGLGEWARHLALPWLTLAMVLAATYIRLTRAALLEVLGLDYIRTARSKGISERRVTTVHALRAAIAPVTTQFGIDLATLLGGVIVTESIFGLQGIGRLALLSVTTQDRPVVIGIVLAASFFIVVANILVDMLYAVLDPRVRLA